MASPSAVAFYPVAHLEDWQLMMNPNALWDLQEPTNRVVMIYLTADNAGGQESYWVAKEEAGIASARYAIALRGPLNEARSPGTMNGHLVSRWSGGNAVAYFLRLPDGNVNGEGFVSQRFQSLKKLHDGAIASIEAVDGSASYDGWHELVDTLQAIIDHEASGIASITLIPTETSTRTTTPITR